MFLWHSTHSRLPWTLLPNLSAMTCRSRGLPSAPGTENPSLPWQPRQVSLVSSEALIALCTGAGAAAGLSFACASATSGAKARITVAAIRRAETFGKSIVARNPCSGRRRIINQIDANHGAIGAPF